MLATELLEVLEKEYPDKASVLRPLAPNTQIEYLAKLELIEYIRLLIEKDN